MRRALTLSFLLLAGAAVAQDAATEATAPGPQAFTASPVAGATGEVVLEWTPMPQAKAYVIYRQYEGAIDHMMGSMHLDEAMVDVVPWGQIDPTPGATHMRVVVDATADGDTAPAAIWAVSAVIDDVETMLSWTRLAPVPTAVGPASWARLKAGVR